MDTNTAAASDDVIDIAFREAPAPANDAPAPAAAPAPVAAPTAKLHLSFAYMGKDGNGAPVQRLARTFLAGVPDLFTQANVEEVEAMLATQMQVESPVLLDWKRLIA